MHAPALAATLGVWLVAAAADRPLRDARGLVGLARLAGRRAAVDHRAGDDDGAGARGAVPPPPCRRPAAAAAGGAGEPGETPPGR
ncbi:MAG: hypothetical protein MZW92_28580 [Comamonadaceae bacterium]|nr:hypothetical protein [Comamonadaceae bacterium]